MKPKERLEAAIKGEALDRIPFHLNCIRWTRRQWGCACPLHQLRFAKEFGLDQFILVGAYTHQSLSNDYVYSPGAGHACSALGFYGDLPSVNLDVRVENKVGETWYHRVFQTPAGVLRDIIQWPHPNTGYGDGPNPHRVEPLIKTKADLAALRFLFPTPRHDMAADIALYKKIVDGSGMVAGYDTTHVGGWGMEALGPENMLIASVDTPELLEGICDMTTDVHLANLKTMLENGVDVVFDSWFQCGPSVGWSPGTFEKFFLPCVRKSIELTHAYNATYIYQDDGKMKAIIPSLVDAGVDVISGLQPPSVGDVDLTETKREFGRRVTLMGGMDPCYAFDLGDRRKVREAVMKCLEAAGDGGRYILGTAEAINGEVPPEFIKAAVDALGDYHK